MASQLGRKLGEHVIINSIANYPNLLVNFSVSQSSSKLTPLEHMKDENYDDPLVKDFDILTNDTILHFISSSNLFITKPTGNIYSLSEDGKTVIYVAVCGVIVVFVILLSALLMFHVSGNRHTKRKHNSDDPSSNIMKDKRNFEDTSQEMYSQKLDEE